MLCSNHKAFNHCTQFNFLELAKIMWKFFGWVFFKSTPILHTNFSYKNHHYCISFTLILPFTYKTYFLTCPCTVSALRKLCTLHRLPGGEQVDSVCLCSLVCCSWKTLINQKKTNTDHSFFLSLHHPSIMIFIKQIKWFIMWYQVIPNVRLISFEHFLKQQIMMKPVIYINLLQ